MNSEMNSELFFADSAGHTLIDVEAASMPHTAANDDSPPTSLPKQAIEDSPERE